MSRIYRKKVINEGWFEKGSISPNKGKKLPQLSGKNSPSWKGGRIKRICIICGKQFEVKRYLKDIVKYCSKKCFYKAKERKVKYKCEVCGKIFETSSSRKPCLRKFCSRECWRKKKNYPHTQEAIEKMKGKHLGEKSGNWKGGITPENVKIRQSIEYHLWRKVVFVRDNFICQKYGIKGGKLVAHHINNFADFPELRFAIDNGITFSEKAHKEFHKKYGIKNNTEEQLEEFLK